MQAVVVAALMAVQARGTEVLVAAVAEQVDQPLLEPEEAQAEPMAQQVGPVVPVVQIVAAVVAVVLILLRVKPEEQAAPASLSSR